MGIKNKRLEAIFSRLSQVCPNPETELEYTTPYTLLIAVMLSAQTTDKQVNKCTRVLFGRAQTPQEMLKLTVEEIEQCINTIGLYRQKARYVLQISRQLVTHHNGVVPQTREELQRMPGVGRKTANVVLNVAFQQPTIPVDTHVGRVARRLGMSGGQTPLAVEKDLEKGVPFQYRHLAHHLMILHGRYTCRARRPLCEQCVLSDICPRLGVSG